METPQHRLKRLAMRSGRRGIKEMDLVLGAFAAAELDRMGPAELDAYEALLDENDQDLLAWITGQAQIPAAHAPLIARILAGVDELRRVPR